MRATGGGAGPGRPAHEGLERRGQRRRPPGCRGPRQRQDRAEARTGRGQRAGRPRGRQAHNAHVGDQLRLRTLSPPGKAASGDGDSGCVRGVRAAPDGRPRSGAFGARRPGCHRQPPSLGPGPHELRQGLRYGAARGAEGRSLLGTPPGHAGGGVTASAGSAKGAGVVGHAAPGPRRCHRRASPPESGREARWTSSKQL